MMSSAGHQRQELDYVVFVITFIVELSSGFLNFKNFIIQSNIDPDILYSGYGL